MSTRFTLMSLQIEFDVPFHLKLKGHVRKKLRNQMLMHLAPAIHRITLNLIVKMKKQPTMKMIQVKNQQQKRLQLKKMNH